MTTAVATKKEERRVVFASSLGTVFEWYDFYLYATLAPFFAALFFPKGNETAALLSAFASVGRVWVGPLAGVLAESIGWPAFFIVSTFAALPALAMLWWMRASVRALEA